MPSRVRIYKLILLASGIIGLRIITEFLLYNDNNSAISSAKIIYHIDRRNVFISNREKVGVRFNVSANMIHSLGLPKMYFNKRLDDESRAQSFVFVTYANERYFSQLKASIDRLQSVIWDRYIIVYDLGLNRKQTAEVLSWCNVKYRKFDFSKYPKHVKNLRNYAFKALVWQVALEEFGAALFIDATVLVAIRERKFSDVVTAAVESGGFLLFSEAGHSTYAATNAKMYEYFPIDVTKSRKMSQYVAEAFVLNNKRTYWKILHWLYMCALDEDCIAPPGSKRYCDFPEDHYDTYANCHRYDQSALNLLALDAYNDTSWIYPNHNERVFAIRRFANRKPNSYSLRTCNL